MEKKRRQEHLKNIIFCLLGTLIIALGVNMFVIPGNLGEGGAIGLSLILNYTLEFHLRLVHSSLMPYSLLWVGNFKSYNSYLYSDNDHSKFYLS